MEDEIMNSDDIQDTSAFGHTDEELNSRKRIIKVIGVGGGGCNAVNYMFHQDIPDVNYVVTNTDHKSLKMMDVPEKVQMGPGLGAGNKPEEGRRLALESIEKIKKIFDDETEMVFITAGMGGGTGTGAGPIVAQAAKEAGMLTIGIVTVPFLFEGEKKILTAIEGANEMKQHVDALLVVNNQNLLDIHPDLNFFNAFEKVDDTLANAARSISEIISEECYVSVDFNDVKTTLKESGTAIISTGYGEGEKRITNAIHNALYSPLLKKHDIKTSKRLLLKVSCARNGNKPITATEIREIEEFTSMLPSSIEIKWGLADKPELGDKVKITVLASGFDVTLTENQMITAATGEIDEGPISFGEGENVMSPKGQTVSKEQIAGYYGESTSKEIDRARLKKKYIILTTDEFDDDDVINSIERKPTLHRDSRQNDEIHELHKHEHQPKGPEPGNEGSAIMFG